MPTIPSAGQGGRSPVQWGLFSVVMVKTMLDSNNKHEYWGAVSVCTHNNQQVHLTGPHSHPRCHISRTMECTCSSDKQTEGGDRGLWLESVTSHLRLTPYPWTSLPCFTILKNNFNPTKLNLFCVTPSLYIEIKHVYKLSYSSL